MFSRHVKLVDLGTDNISHCLVLHATGSLTFDSMVLYLEIFYFLVMCSGGTIALATCDLDMDNFSSVLN